MCLLFLKLNQSQNTKKKFFLGVFLQKPKTRFFGGENKIVLKLKFQIRISAFVLYCKRKLRTNFHQKILIFEPPGIFWKWKLWRMHCTLHAPKFWIWTSKIMHDLWLVDLFCLIKKKFQPPPYCTVHGQLAQQWWDLGFNFFRVGHPFF